MNLENICYIVGAASLDGVRLSPRPGDYVIAADGGYRTLKAGQKVNYDTIQGPKGHHVSVIIPVTEDDDTTAP